ncbi:MAG TPA: hypothetical protein VN726_22315 [Hanamia sp.]|nr:hypothetical protein [Hanamia sp.]
MKRLLVTLCALALVFVCKESVAQKQKMKAEKVSMKEKGMDNISYPYTAMYSSDFKIGNPGDAKLVLDLWKDYDDNAFDRHDLFADTAVMFLADGTVIRGKDSIVAGAKQFRGALSSSMSTLDAWVPLKSVDKNENWVALWGTETDAWPDGKTAKRDIHEIWRINKDGKVDFMKQFQSKPAEMQQ